MKKVLLSLISIFLLAAIFVVAINVYIIEFAKPYTYKNLADLPEKYTVIVPGAKVYSNGVSSVVRDRLAGASECIKSSKCERVLISGDHGRKNYDEVNRMRIFMQEVYGIDEDIIFLDHAGFSTYETMYRARDIFCVDKAVVVTQKFHTARSVYIARKLGLDVVAYEAPELTAYAKSTKESWEIREVLARVKNFFIVLFRAKPTYLGEKIPITGNSKDSWDMLD